MSIYKNIQKLCKDKGLSVTALETELGFTRGYLYKWENHTPSIENVKNVSDYFGITVDELIKEGCD